MTTVDLNVEGMHCASCVARVETALRSVNGVDEARVNLATNQATVSFPDHVVDLAALLEAASRSGYPSTLVADRQPGAVAHRQHVELAGWWWRLMVGLSLLVPLLFLHHLVALPPLWRGWLTVALATPAQIFVGWPYFIGAVERLRHRSVNMDTLVALGTGVAYGHGIAGWLAGTSMMTLIDAVMILTFITFGKYLESRARGRASQAIFRLMDLTPDEAIVMREGKPKTVRPETVGAGETLLVRPGDRVPLDVTIVSGRSDVDESWLTGESISVEKGPGDRLLAGTINGQGSLTGTVTQIAGTTALDRVIELVRRAQESKADVQKLADRVVAWFVPVVLAISLLTLMVWGLWASDWPFGLSCAVAVLVVACPCALGLATPMAVIVGTGRGAEAGILIKDANVLEIAGQLDTVVLDKTGTITSGIPKIVDVQAVADVDPNTMLATAAAVEQLSSHPLARAVVEAAQDRGLELPEAADLNVVAGAGVSAVSQGRQVLLGNDRLLDQFQVAVPNDARAEARTSRELGRQTLLVAIDGKYQGTLVAEDTVAPGAAAAVEQLKQLGLRVLMLSGDKETTAKRIAAAVGIQEVIAEVRPDDKEQHIRNLQGQGHTVAMVGDGINDAPALAAADLGVALGTGADVAIETADVVLVKHDLLAVPRAIRLSRKTLRTIRQNLFWAFAYNVLLLPLAAGVLVPWFDIRVPPALAAAAMAASSVSVVGNSLLLRLWKST